MSGLLGCMDVSKLVCESRMRTMLRVPALARRTVRRSDERDLCVFGERDVGIAVNRTTGDRLAVAGYVRSDGKLVDCVQLLDRLRRDGARAIAKLRGEFALAARIDGTIVLARDSLGTRPLYYAEHPRGGLVFGSLIAPLLAAGISSEPDRHAIVTSLILGYVPSPRTAVANVRQVGPGEMLTFGPSRASWRYYRPAERLDRQRSMNAAARNLDRVLSSAVRDALPARGRIGAFLSGGIDSSLVLARIRELGRDVEAFTLHFGDALPGEIRYARATARHLGVPHHVLEVDARAFCDAIDPALLHLEDLLSEPIAVPNFLLARTAARAGVDVLFTGEGGDPPFGGPKNVGMALAWAYHRMPGAPTQFEAYLTAHHHLADDLDAAIAPAWLAHFDREALRAHIEPFIARTNARHSFVGRLMIANTVLKGGNNILVKAARMLGAHDLAPRSPLFDRRVVDAAFTIPPWHKLRGTEEKEVLKRAVSRTLPREVIDRPKRGMGVPLSAWCDGALGAMARDVLTPRAVRDRGLFRWSYVDRLLRDERIPTDLARSRRAEKLWLVLVAELQQRALERNARSEAHVA